MRFNSLQTGRHIQTIVVSIKTLNSGERFQFPSNGKAHSDVKTKHLNFTMRMSGFNSLQTGRHIQTQSQKSTRRISAGFQFPSNGKAHSDCQCLCRKRDCVLHGVSIPFKREGTFRQCNLVFVCCFYDFVSIPFKREGTFRQQAIPPNSAIRDRVSIPFKREGTFRLTK